MVSMTELRRASDHEIEVLETLLRQDVENAVKAVRNGSDLLGETVFAILHGGQYAGFCTFRGASDEIFPLVIFKPYRRQGVGFAAMQQLIAVLRQHHVEEVAIEVLPGAESFWQKVFAGFPATPNYDGTKFTYALS
ncbi:GNAT family N-acetyltransferase [Pseudomonas sp. BCRC 81390]|uniref:GNAT family N-acetyltransferase n=1 Tax=Pseudomonas sp. BCRC 81390 TaxID=3054778 RepID=UPI00259213C7|nr:GNAT family N-acetyltransferase [Pseudomonas sp. BCRC 81390]MDM3886010.1 GNAT family N-acetyltransferase [Pseudomonas sp. BCRC 81390]